MSTGANGCQRTPLQELVHGCERASTDHDGHQQMSTGVKGCHRLCGQTRSGEHVHAQARARACTLRRTHVRVRVLCRRGFSIVYVVPELLVQTARYRKAILVVITSSRWSRYGLGERAHAHGVSRKSCTRRRIFCDPFPEARHDIHLRCACHAQITASAPW